MYVFRFWAIRICFILWECGDQKGTENCFVVVGGGILELNIDHTLTVDGYIKANSENVRGVTNWYSASGGSGGSIHITTVNYTGQE